MFSNPPYLVSKLFEINPAAVPKLFLVDVGVSEGIHELWRLWTDKLSGVGFDPLESEINRLNRIEKNKNFHYHSAYVSSNLPQNKSNEQTAMSRSSAVALPQYEKSKEKNIYRIPDKINTSIYFEKFQDKFNNNQKKEYSEEIVILDKYLKDISNKICVLKTDTDGFDYQALYGAKNLIKQQKFIFIQVESSFRITNKFSDIDSFLTENGYSLYNIQPYKYSKRSLPIEFCYNIPAQTIKGQVEWADCIYALDVVGKKINPSLKIRALAPEESLQLALLFDLFDLGDCAAEIILEIPSLPLTEEEKKSMLDFLANKYTNFDSFAKLHDKFWKNPFKKAQQVQHTQQVYKGRLQLLKSNLIKTVRDLIR